MSQAGEYCLLKALGKEPNPNSIKITQIAAIDGKNAWSFPDGSKMMFMGGSTYVEVEEVK